MVPSTRSMRSRQASSRCCAAPSSGIGSGRRRTERFGVGGVVRIAEQPYAQLGLLERLLAAPVQADATLVGGQRFLEAHLAVFHLLDQLFERVEGVLEI